MKSSATVAQGNVGDCLDLVMGDDAATQEQNLSISEAIQQLNAVTERGAQAQEMLEGQVEMAKQGVSASSEAVQGYYQEAHDIVRLMTDPVTDMLGQIHENVDQLAGDARDMAKKVKLQQQ